LEADVSKTSMINYCIICINGRYGWIPYQEYLTVQSTKEVTDEKRIDLNYGDVSSKIFGTNISISVEFKFTNDTISKFSNVLGTFPEQKNES
jgi:hypothetical protein